MVDGVNNGNSKEWHKINDTLQNQEYRNVLEDKINSVLGDNKTVSVNDLQKNSVFGGLSDKALERFNAIAGLDGDSSTFNAEELKVLYTLTDASLKDNSFVFDGKYSVDANSGLEQVTDGEMGVIVKSLVKNNAQKRIVALDPAQFDRNKDFVSKVTSDDADESMLAVQDALQTGFTDKRTGKPVSITQAVMLFEEFVNQSYNKGYKDFYKDVAREFTEQTGIPVSDFKRFRCMGDGDSFTIGDWKYDRGEITNETSGQSVKMERLNWRNSTDHTIPAANGYIGLITEYNDGKGTAVTFDYGDNENIAPTGATVTSDGKTSTVSYNSKEAVDPDIYNFIER